MSLTLRRNRVVLDMPHTWTGRMKAQARRAGYRLGPMAGQAKVAAAHRIEDARYWAAPRLDHAAHRVEDQIAPRVSALLIQAAEKMYPTPAKSRRWPIMILLAGLALGAAGYVFYRRNAQQWTDHMKDSASDASQWVSEKTDQGASQVSEDADKVANKVADKANETSRKLS
ncbi:hypothetical protein [Nonomuraea sp. NPDC046570]|uniref:hypothetical protein n=1 Tax=Nonomuraea sp. NPDC046570 TaxID=3155255 RepID=UPI0033F6C883